MMTRAAATGKLQAMAKATLRSEGNLEVKGNEKHKGMKGTDPCMMAGRAGTGSARGCLAGLQRSSPST